MLKRISLTISLTIMFVLAGCSGDKIAKSDIDIVYEVKEQITFVSFEVLEDIEIPTSVIEGVQLDWTSSKPEVLSADGTVTRPKSGLGDATVSLTVVITLNEAVTTKSFEFTVLQEMAVFDTRFTDDLVMDFTYENSNFIENGIGEVTLSRCVDGDTAIFKEGSDQFSVRFLGINTPESTYKFEPWGKPASDFTCDKLTNATTIVLEYEPTTTRTDGNERYLAWVWYDGRLLNLELVEEAYTGSKGVGGMKYESLFYSAEFKTQETERRIWGENDDTFDYSLDGIQLTIEELVTNQEEYLGKKVVIRGVVSRNVGGQPYIQQDGYGIFLYIGFADSYLVQEGNYVLIESLVLTYHPDQETGAAQLTNFNTNNAVVISTGRTVTPREIVIDQITRNDIGSLVRINTLEVVSIYENQNDSAFTVTAKDSEGNIISIRRDKSVSAEVSADLFEVGAIFDVIGPISRYNGEYQIMINSIDDVLNQNN